MPNPRFHARWAVASLLVFSVFLSSCGESATDPDGSLINVGIQNSTNAVLEVAISVNGSAAETGFHNPGYSSTEVNGTSGNVVGFSATGLGGGSCTATNAIVGTLHYGQVNFFFEQPSGVFVFECSSGWLEFGAP